MIVNQNEPRKYTGASGGGRKTWFTGMYDSAIVVDRR